MSDEKEHLVDIHILKRHVPFGIVAFILALALFAVGFGVYFYRGSLNYSIFLLDKTGKVPLVVGSWPALEDPEFFKDVKGRFIADRADFIDVDLSSMTLRLYEKGEIAMQMPILSKGKEGSWWETPAGVYKIEGKEDIHFSSFGNVYMPWSMPFQGNFFIHGWPYYPGGASVESTYSGGCIRISTEDAEALFKRVNAGIPVLVFEKDFDRDGFQYSPRVPLIGANTYLGADLTSNFVLVEKNSREVLPIASLTKLMTAVVATEFYNIERDIPIDQSMLATTSRPRLRAGQSVSVLDLLHLLLRESSNEAAEALASAYYNGRSGFIGLMNEKAKAIGMYDTKFIDPSGYGGENVSTAEDLFALAKYLYNNRRFVLKISAGRLEKNVYPMPRYSDLGNYNVFVSDPEFVGGKVGLSTPAQGTAIAVFETELNKVTRPIVLVVLSSSDYERDIRTFMKWLKDNY